MPRWLPILLVLAGCGAAAATPSYWPGDATWQPALQPGDYVVYQYTGRDIPTPVLVKKEVVERRHDRVVIDVVATRGADRRHWSEEVADAQVGRQDHQRLGDWVVAMPDRGSTGTSETVEVVHLEGWSFECTKSFGETVWNGVEVRVSSTTCPSFPWSRWEQGFWDDDHTIASVEVVETGRGGYRQVACPDGTTPVRAKEFDSVEETCARADGARHGPWRARDGHGTTLVSGRYASGAKDGLWTDRRYAYDGGEQCLFDDGDPARYRKPLHWTHLRFGAGFGGGYHVGADAGVASMLAQVGWDLWSPKQHCHRVRIRKQLASRSVAAIADLHLLVQDDDPTTLVRLGVQGYAVKPGFFDTGLFASAGVIVSPRLGVGASIGVELIVLRLEARYDYLGDDEHLLTVNGGVSDGFLAVFD